MLSDGQGKGVPAARGVLLSTATVAKRLVQEEQPAEALNVAQWLRENATGFYVALALVALLFAPNLVKLWNDWRQDDNYSHGFLVLPVFAWMIWQSRKALAQTQVQPRGWGLAVVAIGVLQLFIGALGAEYFVSHSALLVVLCGMTLYLFGTEMLKKLSFAIAWLIFMIPLPSILLYAVTFPLQTLATQLSSGLLDLMGIPNLREGNVLFLPNFTVGVVEACSGIRSLISLLCFGTLLGHLLGMSATVRWLVAISAVPTALGMNAMRVAGTGLMGNFWGAKWAEGFFHTFSGWLLFIGAVAVLFAWAQLLNGVARKWVRRRREGLNRA
jgi:exosortase